MKLFYNPMSPFARKVRVAAEENGLTGKIEVVLVNPWNDESLRAFNPFCQVPTLALADGSSLYDSRVICAYLDDLGEGALLPTGGAARIRALWLEAVGDGVNTAAVRRVTEGRRPKDDQHADVIARQTQAIRAGLTTAQAAVGADGAFTLGEAAIACALGYLDFRLPQDVWREEFPALASWYAAIETRPSLAMTAPVQI